MNAEINQPSMPRIIWLTIICVFTTTLHLSAQSEEKIRVDAELVNLNVVVSNRNGQRVSKLKREDFEVYEDGVKQEISHFSAESRPLRLVLLFDTSISMEAALPTLKQQGASFIDNLNKTTVSPLSLSTVSPGCTLASHRKSKPHNRSVS